MQLEWVGQLCPPGQFADFSGICRPVPGIPQTPQAAPQIDIPVVTVTPAPSPEEEKNKTLLYAGLIVGAGIITAVVLTRMT